MENLSIQSESEFLGYWYLWQYNTIQYNTNIVIDICDNAIQLEYKYCNWYPWKYKWIQ